MTSALGSPYDVSGAAHLPNSAFRPAAGALAGLGTPGQNNATRIHAIRVLMQALAAEGGGSGRTDRRD